MRKIGAWLGMLGGLLWAFKAGYDWLWLGRVINRGYLPADPTDYIEFLFPILCIGSLLAMAGHYRLRFGYSHLIAAIGLLLIGAFQYSEAYLVDSNIPAGMMFLFTGSLSMLLGLYMLLIKLCKAKTAPRSLIRLIAAQFTVTCLFCLSPFLTGTLPNDIATAITATLMSLIGFMWAAVGGVQLRR